MTTITIDKKTTKAMFDEQVAKRLLTFRETYVHKSQNQAAKMLGVTQSSLSYYEGGTRAIPMHLVEKLTKNFNLNVDWLTSGKLPKQIKPTGKDKGDLITDVSALNDEIRTLRKQIKVFEATQNHMMKMIERMGKQLDGLVSGK